MLANSALPRRTPWRTFLARTSSDWAVAVVNEPERVDAEARCCRGVTRVMEAQPLAVVVALPPRAPGRAP